MTGGSLFGSWTGWLVGQSVICSVVQIAGWSVCHLFGRSFSMFVGRYFAWSGGRWIGQSVVWSVDWLVDGLVAGLVEGFQPRRDHEGADLVN